MTIWLNLLAKLTNFITKWIKAKLIETRKGRQKRHKQLEQKILIYILSYKRSPKDRKVIKTIISSLKNDLFYTNNLNIIFQFGIQYRYFIVLIIMREGDRRHTDKYRKCYNS